MEIQTFKISRLTNFSNSPNSRPNMETADVILKKHDLRTTISTANERYFLGQKLLHPFDFSKVTFKNKMGKVISANVYMQGFSRAEIEEDIFDADRIDIKHDGSCGYIRYCPDFNEFKAYGRYDVSRSKTGEFPEIDPLYIPCEPKPTHILATHWPHFRSCGSDKKGNYKWHITAFNQFMQKNIQTLYNVKQSFTCEFMGPHFNAVKSDPFPEDTIIVHGMFELCIPRELRTYDGFFNIMKEMPFIEGLIVHGKSGQVYKIRRDLFFDPINDETLKWGKQNYTEIYNTDPIKYYFLEKSGLSSILTL